MAYVCLSWSMSATIAVLQMLAKPAVSTYALWSFRHDEGEILKASAAIVKTFDLQSPHIFPAEHRFHEMRLSVRYIEPLAVGFEDPRNLFDIFAYTFFHFIGW